MPAPSVTVVVPLRPTDFDGFAHVHNTVYFDLMEVGRARWFAEAGPRARVVIARSECNHRVEIPAGTDAVDVTVLAESVGRTSFVLRHDLAVAGRLHADGRTVMVKLDAAGAPTPWLDAERRTLLGEAPQA